MKNPASFKSLILLSFFILMTCTAATSQKTKDRYNPRFDYQPPTRTAVANSGLTIALIKPVFMDREIDKYGSPWSDFANSMQSEVEELLIAKGYKVRGPFQSRDEMVFNDKKQSDFVLTVNIDLRIDNQIEWKKIFGPGGFKIKHGNLSIQAGIIITAISNFSGEKLWKKNLQLEQQNFTYEGTHDWRKKDYVTFKEEYDLENNLANPLNKALEEIYKEAMKILWSQFEINEMRGVANEAKNERNADSQKKEK